MTVKNFVPPGSSVFGFSSVAGYYGAPTNRYPQPLEFANYTRGDQPRFPSVEIPLKNDVADKDDQNSWEAMQREWRTPPLWGLRQSGPYLHDGRATTFDQAIRWHGGEATDAVAKYERITAANRKKLHAFLNSLTVQNAWACGFCPVGN